MALRPEHAVLRQRHLVCHRRRADGAVGRAGRSLRGYAHSHDKTPQRSGPSGSLTASGFYNMSHEFHGSAPVKTKMFE